MEEKNSMNIIYYGSYEVVEEPSIIKGKYTKDFGYGFYCTRNKEQAEYLAKKYKTPIVNAYYLKDLSDLRVKKFEKYNEEWLDFVVECRAGRNHEFDVVEGYVANDTIYEVIDEYLNGKIDKLALLDMMKFKWGNNQISFHSARALSKLVFLESYILNKED